MFLTLSNCASVGEKTLIIIKIHVVYVEKKVYLTALNWNVTARRVWIKSENCAIHSQPSLMNFNIVFQNKPWPPLALYLRFYSLLSPQPENLLDPSMVLGPIRLETSHCYYYFGNMVHSFFTFHFSDCSWKNAALWLLWGLSWFTVISFSSWCSTVCTAINKIQRVMYFFIAT